MLVSKEQVKQALTMYVDTELMPKGNGLEKVATVWIMYLLTNRLDTLWLTLDNNPYLGVLGIEVVGGKIESNKLLEAAKYAFDRCGATNVRGVILARADIDTFERCLNNVVAMGV